MKSISRRLCAVHWHSFIHAVALTVFNYQSLPTNMFNIIIKWIISNRFIFFSVSSVRLVAGRRCAPPSIKRQKEKKEKKRSKCVFPAFAPLQFEIDIIKLYTEITCSRGAVSTDRSDDDLFVLRLCDTQRSRQISTQQTMVKRKSNIFC